MFLPRCKLKGPCSLDNDYNAIIIIIIIIILVTPSMHGIYNYTPATSPVPTVYTVAAVLYLQSVLHVMLFRPCSMFCTFTSALYIVIVIITIIITFMPFISNLTTLSPAKNRTHRRKINE